MKPIACVSCKLVNWPDHMDGEMRTDCHKCGKPVRCPTCGGELHVDLLNAARVHQYLAAVARNDDVVLGLIPGVR